MKEAEAREAAKPLEQRKTEALQKVIDTCERAKNVSDLIDLDGTWVSCHFTWAEEWADGDSKEIEKFIVAHILPYFIEAIARVKARYEKNGWDFNFEARKMSKYIETPKNEEEPAENAVSEEEIKVLEEKGLTRWTKGDYDRLYINLKSFGFHSGMQIDGFRLNAEEARFIEKGFEAYIDIKTGKIAVKYAIYETLAGHLKAFLQDYFQRA